MKFSNPGDDHPEVTPAAGVAGESKDPPPQMYPLPRPNNDDDPRFNFGLFLDVGQVLANHGYPPIASGADVVRLNLALFTFIYGTSSEAREAGQNE